MLPQYAAQVLSVMILRWFQLPPIITGVTSVFTFHMRCIYIVKSLYFIIFSASLFIIFVSLEFAASVYTRSFCIVTYYDVRFIVSDSSVRLHLFIPSYGYLTFLTCYWFWYIFRPVSIIYCYPFNTCMHGIYNYIHETNCVSRVYSVAAVLYLQTMIHVMLFRP